MQAPNKVAVTVIYKTTCHTVNALLHGYSIQMLTTASAVPVLYDGNTLASHDVLDVL